MLARILYLHTKNMCKTQVFFEIYCMQARLMCIYIYYIFIRYSTLNTHIVVLVSFRPFKAKQIQTLPLPLCQADINDSPRLPSDWSPLEYELLECRGDHGMVDCCDGWGNLKRHLNDLPIIAVGLAHIFL